MYVCVYVCNVCMFVCMYVCMYVCMPLCHQYIHVTHSVEEASFLLSTAQLQQRHPQDIKSHMTHFLWTAVIARIGLHMSQSIGYFQPIGEELKFLKHVIE